MLADHPHGGVNQNANLGASIDGDPDWGIYRVKYAIGECNPTLCQPEAGLVIPWSDRRERSGENPASSGGPPPVAVMTSW